MGGSAISAGKILGQSAAEGLSDFSGKVYRGSSQAIPDDTLTRVDFNTVDEDVKGDFDTVTNFKLTPTKAGVFLITAGCAINNLPNGNHMRIDIIKNVTNHASGTCVSNGATKINNTRSTALVRVNGTTDSIEAKVTAEGVGNDLIGAIAETFFQWQLVGK